MAECSVPGCPKEALGPALGYSRFGLTTDAPPHAEGVIREKAKCADHILQTKQLKIRLRRAGIGAPHPTVLLNLDKRERRFAQ